MRKPKVTTNPVANQYAGNGERIIEYSSRYGGGLIAFRETDAGVLLVQPYNHDDTVKVTATGIVREAALAFLHGDDSQAISLKSLADALGVRYEDVEGITNQDREAEEAAALAPSVGKYEGLWVMENPLTGKRWAVGPVLGDKAAYEGQREVHTGEWVTVESEFTSWTDSELEAEGLDSDHLDELASKFAMPAGTWVNINEES